MSRLTRRTLGFVLCLGLAPHAWGEGAELAEAKQPFEIVRSLQAIQDQVVLGNAGARSRLPKLITQLSERLLAARPEVWRDPKNARAALPYALSGGPANVLRKVLGLGVSPEPELVLMRGTLAYLEGSHDEAKKCLSQIDPQALPPSLGAHIAMIQSALIAKEDPREALRLLDKARVMLPGTLVEEAALRRALVLAKQISDIDKFAYLSGEYIWRFPKSEYFENFRRQFAEAILHFSLASQAGEPAKIERLIAKLEPPSKLPLYLQIAYLATVAGKAGTALNAAIQAKQLSGSGTTGRARAELYEAAALLLTGHFEAAIEELSSVDDRLLPRQDFELKEATVSLAKAIGSAAANMPEYAGPEPAQPEKPSSDSSSGADNPVAGLIAQAQLKLAGADAILHRNSP